MVKTTVKKGGRSSVGIIGAALSAALVPFGFLTAQKKMQKTSKKTKKSKRKSRKYKKKRGGAEGDEMTDDEVEEMGGTYMWLGNTKYIVNEGNGLVYDLKGNTVGSENDEKFKDLSSTPQSKGGKKKKSRRRKRKY
jgi:hypothetical protein